MDIVWEIQNAKTFEEMEKIIDKRIEEETKKSIKQNPGVNIIGPNIGINPSAFLLEKDFNKLTQECTGYYSGFIPKGIKLVYGIFTDVKNCCQSNHGYYYYNEDFDYLYKFANYIRGFQIEHEFNIIECVFKFIKEYYENWLEPKNREEIHRLLLSGPDSFFPPTMEHTNRDFIKNNAARCSEFAIFATNILNVLGIKTFYVQNERHAFNIVCLKDEDDKEKTNYYLLDNSYRVACYNLNGIIYEDLPYVELIEDFDENKLFDFINGDDDLTMPCYFVVFDGNLYCRYYVTSKRKYYVLGDYYLYNEDDEDSPSILVKNK